jgi:hypothetical protein
MTRLEKAIKDGKMLDEAKVLSGSTSPLPEAPHD